MFPSLQLLNGRLGEGYGLWAVLRYSDAEGEGGREAKEMDLSGRGMTTLKGEVGGEGGWGGVRMGTAS